MAVGALSVAQLAQPAPTHAATSGPALNISASTLQDALTCSSDLATPSKTPMLLLPGTIETPESAYSWGYQKVLQAQGHPVCAVTYPKGGVGDMQVTVEYVVNAIRYMYSTSGTKISTIGHSQGGLLAAWALRFWPDLVSKVDDVISLDSPYGGTKIADYVCGFDSCPPLAWQVTRNSDWSRALRRYPMPAGPSYSSIGSNNEDLVWPSPDATYLPGATNLLVQDLCPGRYVSHVDMLDDAAVYALVDDALTHTGAASASRADSTSCSKTYFPGIDSAARNELIVYLDAILSAIFNASFVDAEPALRDYAVGATGDTNLALGMHGSVSSTESSTLGGQYAVDGKLGTRWASQWWHDPEWIYVDLGSTRTIDGVQVLWEDAYAEQYDIQTWNGSSWVTAYTVSNGRGDNEFVPVGPIDARYVRLYGRERATNYGYSIYEFQVVGH